MIQQRISNSAVGLIHSHNVTPRWKLPGFCGRRWSARYGVGDGNAVGDGEGEADGDPLGGAAATSSFETVKGAVAR